MRDQHPGDTALAQRNNIRWWHISGSLALAANMPVTAAPEPLMSATALTKTQSKDFSALVAIALAVVLPAKALV
jgi:hypothetical protein